MAAEDVWCSRTGSGAGALADAGTAGAKWRQISSRLGSQRVTSRGKVVTTELVESAQETPRCGLPRVSVCLWTTAKDHWAPTPGRYSTALTAAQTEQTIHLIDGATLSCPVLQVTLLTVEYAFQLKLEKFSARLDTQS